MNSQMKKYLDETQRVLSTGDSVSMEIGVYYSPNTGMQLRGSLNPCLLGVFKCRFQGHLGGSDG